MTIAEHSVRNTEIVAPGARLLFVNDIAPSSLNPRKVFDQDGLDELASSIQQDGLIEPLVVRPNPARKSDHPLHADGPRWELIAGERRWRACQLIGVQQVLCVVREADDATALRLALVENLQRRDLDPIEEAEGYAQLNRVVGLRQAEIAAAVNRSQPAVANAMRLLELPDDVRERIRRRELSVSHGIALAKWKAFPGVLQKLAELAIKNDMTSKDVERWKPDHSQLGNDLARPVAKYNVAFDTSVCQECPFNAYRKGQYGQEICLNPAHWKELQDAAVAERKAQEAAAVAAATEGAGAELPNVKDLRNIYYISTHGRPEACTDACPCRVLAIGHQGTPVECCTDWDRYRRLQEEERAAKTQEREMKRAQRSAEVAVEIDERKSLGARDLAPIVAAAVRGFDAATVSQAGRHLGDLLPEKGLQKLLSHGGQTALTAMLAQADRDALIRFGLETVLLADLRIAYSEYGGDGEEGRAGWWLGTPADTAPESVDTSGVSTDVPTAPSPEFMASIVTCADCGDALAVADAVPGEENGQLAWFCPECAEFDGEYEAPGSLADELAASEVAPDMPTIPEASADGWDAAKAELATWKAEQWAEGDEDGAE